jgi:hypothetical protein
MFVTKTKENKRAGGENTAAGAAVIYHTFEFPIAGSPRLRFARELLDETSVHRSLLTCPNHTRPRIWMTQGSISAITLRSSSLRFWWIAAV